MRGVKLSLLFAVLLLFSLMPLVSAGFCAGTIDCSVYDFTEAECNSQTLSSGQPICMYNTYSGACESMGGACEYFDETACSLASSVGCLWEIGCRADDDLSLIHI